MSEPVVVFDIGNVLLHWDPRHLYRKLFATEAEVDWFLGNICTMDWNLMQDAGRDWAQGVAELSTRHPEWAAEIAAYDQRWAEMIPGPVMTSVSVLNELNESQRKAYAISNISTEKWAEIQALYPFFALFDGVVVSAHEKILKPDAAIYQIFLKRYGLAAAECVFVDDSERNIHAAAALGMKTVHFTPETDLRAALRGHGVELQSNAVG